MIDLLALLILAGISFVGWVLFDCILREFFSAMKISHEGHEGEAKCSFAGQGRSQVQLGNEGKL